MSLMLLLAVAIFVVILGVVIFAAMRARQPGPTRGDAPPEAGPSGAMEEFVCQNCGGELSNEHIILRAGASFVSCPYCGSEYRLVK